MVFLGNDQLPMSSVDRFIGFGVKCAVSTAFGMTDTFPLGTLARRTKFSLATKTDKINRKKKTVCSTKTYTYVTHKCNDYNWTKKFPVICSLIRRINRQIQKGYDR